MVIFVQLSSWEVKRVLIYPRNSIDVLYRDTFKGINLDPEKLKTFNESLVGFLGKHVLVKGYITLKQVLGLEENDKIIKVKYLVIDAPYPITLSLGGPILTVQNPLCLHSI